MSKAPEALQPTVNDAVVNKPTQFFASGLLYRSPLLFAQLIYVRPQPARSRIQPVALLLTVTPAAFTTLFEPVDNNISKQAVVASKFGEVIAPL